MTQIGFTKTQAKIYLTLLQLKEPDAKALSKASNVRKPEVYRTLNQLQKMGLAEKEISQPYRYVATPVKLGLQILLSQKIQQYEKMQKEIKRFLENHQSSHIGVSREKEYKLRMVEGKHRLMQIIRHQHDRVERSVDLLTTMRRWRQIIDLCHIDYKKELNRGIKYRIVIEEDGSRNNLGENLTALLARPKFNLRNSYNPLETNAAIFDGREATINFFVGKPIGESPIIWTNHPSFIRMCQDHFNSTWKLAIPFEKIA